MMAEHTKGELKTDGTYIFGNSIGGCQMEKADFPIAQIRGWGHLQYLGEDKAIEIQEANAEHLVKCWNAFEEGGLVEKLVGALEKVINEHPAGLCGLTEPPSLVQARQALAEAKK